MSNVKKKLAGCTKLVNMKKKKIERSDIISVAQEIGISTATMENAWRVFQESGGKRVDNRSTTGSGSLSFKRNFICKNKTRKVTAEEAGDIIREYMTTSIHAAEICNKHNISYYQFYTWLHELNVSGKLLGKKVLNHSKYAKIEIKDVIRLNKRPNTTKKSIANLSECERLAYKRVADILLMYLPKTTT